MAQLNKMKLDSLSELANDKQKDIVNSFDTVVTDCDGVLWFNNEIIPDTRNVIEKFKALGKKVFYVTNNSTKSRVALITQFLNFGFNVKHQEIIGTTYLVAHDLKKHLSPEKKVYIVGSSAIADELSAVGIQNFGVGPDPMNPEDLKFSGDDVQLDDRVGAVVVGFDIHIRNIKILKAASYLKTLILYLLLLIQMKIFQEEKNSFFLKLDLY